MAKSTARPNVRATITAASSKIVGINSTKTSAVDGEQQEVLTAAELGKILRIHPVTVRLKAAAGEIPGRQLGNRWRFSRTRINEWLMAA